MLKRGNRALWLGSEYKTEFSGLGILSFGHHLEKKKSVILFFIYLRNRESDKKFLKGIFVDNIIIHTFFVALSTKKVTDSKIEKIRDEKL